MTRTALRRRPGLSLLEVIVALFVMAIGMLALLTLFPLGALQMARALQDARAAETASQADTHMRLWWQRDVVERTAPDVAFAALDDPRNSFDPGNPLNPLLATDTGPSFPVAIDPLGWHARNGTLPIFRQQRLAGGSAAPTNGLFPRRSMDWVRNSPQASAFSFRVASMMDDITFNELGVPDTASTTVTVGVPPNPTIARQGRFNWMAVIQRPVNSTRLVADLKILVFDGRLSGVAPLDTELVFSPVANVAAQGTQIVLNVGAANPNPAQHLRAGMWIMDGTLANAGVTAATPAVRNAIFYRIQSIDKDSIAGQYVIDLQSPLVRDVYAPVVGSANPPTQFYVFKGLLEVFDRPRLAPPDYKLQTQ